MVYLTDERNKTTVRYTSDSGNVPPNRVGKLARRPACRGARERHGLPNEVDTRLGASVPIVGQWVKGDCNGNCSVLIRALVADGYSRTHILNKYAL